MTGNTADKQSLTGGRWHRSS